jgi:hypothetical protein
MSKRRKGSQRPRPRRAGIRGGAALASFCSRKLYPRSRGGRPRSACPRVQPSLRRRQQTDCACEHGRPSSCSIAFRSTPRWLSRNNSWSGWPRARIARAARVLAAYGRGREVVIPLPAAQQGAATDRQGSDLRRSRFYLASTVGAPVEHDGGPYRQLSAKTLFLPYGRHTRSKSAFTKSGLQVDSIRLCGPECRFRENLSSQSTRLNSWLGAEVSRKGSLYAQFAP